MGPSLLVTMVRPENYFERLGFLLWSSSSRRKNTVWRSNSHPTYTPSPTPTLLWPTGTVSESCTFSNTHQRFWGTFRWFRWLVRATVACGWTGGALCFFSFFTQKSKKKPCHKCRSTISLSAGFFCMNTCKSLEKKLIKYCSKTSQKCSAPPHHFNYSLKQRQKKLGPTPLLAGCATPCRTKTVQPLVYPPPSDVWVAGWVVLAVP